MLDVHHRAEPEPTPTSTRWQCQNPPWYGPTWLFFSLGTWNVPFTWPGALKNSSIKGQTGHCSALPRLESDGLSRGTRNHQSRRILILLGGWSKSGVVQSILPNDAYLLSTMMSYDNTVNNNNKMLTAHGSNVMKTLTHRQCNNSLTRL